MRRHPRRRRISHIWSVSPQCEPSVSPCCCREPRARVFALVWLRVAPRGDRRCCAIRGTHPGVGHRSHTLLHICQLVVEDEHVQCNIALDAGGVQEGHNGWKFQQVKVGGALACIEHIQAKIHLARAGQQRKQRGYPSVNPPINIEK